MTIVMATTKRDFRGARRSLLEARLLDTLRGEPETLASLARTLGVSSRTVLRLIRSLRQEGNPILLVSDGRRRVYRIGTIENPRARTGTALDLLNSGLVGMWADRKDIRSGVDYVRRIRRLADKRLA